VERWDTLRKQTQTQLHVREKAAEAFPSGSFGIIDADATNSLAIKFETWLHALDALVTHTSDVVLALHEDFQVVALNPSARSTLALSERDSLHQPCSQVLHCENLNHMALCGTSSCPLTQVLQSKHALANAEIVIGTQPDHSLEVSASVVPIIIDNQRYAIFTARNLSALKVANHVRANFVSMVSHELRTPLNSVHGFIDLLLQGQMGALTEEQQLYLGYTAEGVQQLISIVEDILFMTRSDLGQFTIKPQEIHLHSLISQVVRNLQLQAAKAEVTLLLDIPETLPPLYADPQRVKQVLNNLVTNAIKFTPPTGTVTIGACIYDSQFVLLSVTDTGYGIQPEDRQHVFERFYQSNHRQQSKLGGYGLGLSIAKLIIEQHCGFIDFATTIDKGSTFYFTLPRYTSLSAPSV
jgi:signal transduction histidine kinase